jgi:hypothetical protein
VRWPLQRRFLPDGPGAAPRAGAILLAHRFRMDRLDHRIRRGRQEAVDLMRPGDRLGLGTALAFEFGPDAREAVLIGNSLSFRT